VSTSYYAYRKMEHCPCCGQSLQTGQVRKVHLGESAGGWAFMFAGDDQRPGSEQRAPAEGVYGIAEWRALVREAELIIDEYGQTYLADSFIDFVEGLEGKSHAVEYPQNSWLSYGHSFTGGNWS